MAISGFSYVRNGFDYDVPFLESIQSILPICDEFVVAVGDSTDGTREAIEALGSSKIKIVDTVWDMSMRKGGKIFAQQSNIALDHVKGDWAFHIQADEVIHENDLDKVVNAIKENEGNSRVDGFLFPFIHFWGSYSYVRTSRRVHKNEIRVFRNNKCVRSYNESQGFRIYSGKEAYEAGEKGEKLRVKRLDVPIYHYNGVHSPKKLLNKIEKLSSFFHNGKADVVENPELVLQQVDRVELFKGTHPKVMQEKVASQDWEFTFDPKKAVWTKPKDKLMQPIEDFLGFRIGGYKNYKLIK